MKLTKDDIQSMKVGQTKVFTLAPLEMLSARSYIYQFSLVTGCQYKTKYNKKTHDLTVTRHH